MQARSSSGGGRSRHVVELVWTTGRPTSVVSVRSTEQLLFGLIEGAQQTSTVMSFGIFEVPRLVCTLRKPRPECFASHHPRRSAVAKATGPSKNTAISSGTSSINGPAFKGRTSPALSAGNVISALAWSQLRRAHGHSWACTIAANQLIGQPFDMR